MSTTEENDDGAMDFMAALEAQEKDLNGHDDEDDAPRMNKLWTRGELKQGDTHDDPNDAETTQRTSESMMRRLAQKLKVSTGGTRNQSRGSSMSRLISSVLPTQSASSSDSRMSSRGSSLSRMFRTGRSSTPGSELEVQKQDHSEFDIVDEDEAIKLAVEARSRKYGHVFNDDPSSQPAASSNDAFNSVVRSELWERKGSLRLESSDLPTSASLSSSHQQDSKEPQKEREASQSKQATTVPNTPSEGDLGTRHAGEGTGTRSAFADPASKVDVERSSTPTSTEDPYSRFRWMLSNDVPENVVAVKLERANLDPSVLGLSGSETPTSPHRGSESLPCGHAESKECPDQDSGTSSDQHERPLPGAHEGKNGDGAFREEYRIDPSDGFAYTIESFVAEYGGTAEWEAASAATEDAVKMDFFVEGSCGRGLGDNDDGDGGMPELRIDPADGRPYPKEAFVQEYGGISEWEAASPLESEPFGCVEDGTNARNQGPDPQEMQPQPPPPPPPQPHAQPHRRKSGCYRPGPATRDDNSA